MDKIGRGADDCFHDRHIDMLPLPRLALPQERRHNRNRGIAGRDNLGLLKGGAHRQPIALSGGIDKAAHGLGNQIRTLVIPVGPGLAKWRDRDHDQLGIQLVQHLITQSHGR